MATSVFCYLSIAFKMAVGKEHPQGVPPPHKLYIQKLVNSGLNGLGGCSSECGKLFSVPICNMALIVPIYHAEHRDWNEAVIYTEAVNSAWPSLPPVPPPISSCSQSS